MTDIVQYKGYTFIEDPDNPGQPKPTLTEAGGDLIHGNFKRSADRVGHVGLVVAAVDSTDAVRYFADYVCDGTADDVQIQAAIDAAVAAGGGIVFLPTGTYTLAAPIEITGHGVQLVGEGPGGSTTGTLIMFNGAAGEVETAIKATGGTWHHVVISDLHIRSTPGAGWNKGTAIDASYLKFSSIKRIWAHGVQVGINISEPGYYNLIEQFYMSVYGTDSFGIKLDTGSNRTKIVRSMVALHDNSHTGILIKGTGCCIDSVCFESTTSVGTGVDVQAGGNYPTLVSCRFDDLNECVKIAAAIDGVVIIGGAMSGTTLINNLGSGVIQLSGALNELLLDGVDIQIGLGEGQCGGFVVADTVEVQTTNDTQTSLWTLGLVDENTYHAEAQIVGVESDGSQRGSYHIACTVYRTGGGVATLQGAVTVMHSQESNAAWAATFTVNGNNLRVSVTGVVGDTIEWAGSVTYMNITN